MKLLARPYLPWTVLLCLPACIVVAWQLGSARQHWAPAKRGPGELLREALEPGKERDRWRPMLSAALSGYSLRPYLWPLIEAVGSRRRITAQRDGVHVDTEEGLLAHHLLAVERDGESLADLTMAIGRPVGDCATGREGAQVRMGAAAGERSRHWEQSASKAKDEWVNWYAKIYTGFDWDANVGAVAGKGKEVPWSPARRRALSIIHTLSSAPWSEGTSRGFRPIEQVFNRFAEREEFDALEPYLWLLVTSVGNRDFVDHDTNRPTISGREGFLAHLWLCKLAGSLTMQPDADQLEDLRLAQREDDWQSKPLDRVRIRWIEWYVRRYYPDGK